VVDDEVDTLDFVERALRGRFEVVVAQSGETALSLLGSQEFTCVISDQRMPGEIQGADVLGRAALVAPHSVRVLMTGYADTESIIDAINRGRTSAFLKKPFTDQELSVTLDNASEFLSLSVRYSKAISELESRNRELEQLNHELQEHRRLLALTADQRAAELAVAVEQLKQMVFKDALTGLHNHRYFQERLSQEVERAQRHDLELSLLFIDIDNFKLFNDRQGHPAGDEALRAVASLLDRGIDEDRAPSTPSAPPASQRGTPGHGLPIKLRRTDIAARYGGEEFVVILPETGVAAARVVADRIRRNVESIALPGVEQQPGGCLSVSLGIATVPTHAHDKAELIHLADQALFAAKRAGRNRAVVYDPSLETWGF
jgi:PleD family two-component response regulator